MYVSWQGESLFNNIALGDIKLMMDDQNKAAVTADGVTERSGMSCGRGVSDYSRVALL